MGEMEELKAVLDAPIPTGERVLWAKIYLAVGYKAFSGTQAGAADAFNVNKHTFKKHITSLYKRGAVVIRSKYRKDKMGSGTSSARYQLVPFELWNAPEA